MGTIAGVRVSKAGVTHNPSQNLLLICFCVCVTEKTKSTVIVFVNYINPLGKTK